MKTGIIERLKAARSYQEAVMIVGQGKHYEHVAPKTRRRWARLIEQKRREKP